MTSLPQREFLWCSSCPYLKWHSREYLVENKYAARGKVAINGGSNGGRNLRHRDLHSANRTLVGLLVAACVNRAPEGLLGAAVAEVGVLDLLKFADFTIGQSSMLLIHVL